ncbi:unnamed protein product, partial [Mesorhabditis spiculigera]
MYYPYRTYTDFGDTSNSLSGTGNNANNNAGATIAPGSQIQRDTPTGACTTVDPYWCQEYVKQSLDYETKFGGQSQAQVCQMLKNSLVEAVNGCCQALRANGCP